MVCLVDMYIYLWVFFSLIHCPTKTKNDSLSWWWTLLCFWLAFLQFSRWVFLLLFRITQSFPEIPLCCCCCCCSSKIATHRSWVSDATELVKLVDVEITSRNWRSYTFMKNESYWDWDRHNFMPLGRMCYWVSFSLSLFSVCVRLCSFFCAHSVVGILDLVLNLL